MTTSTLSLRLRGESAFTVDELSGIAAYLDVDVRSFFPSLGKVAA